LVPDSRLARSENLAILGGVTIQLTRQQQLVLCAILGLLLVGWAVKVYRTAHPPAAPGVQLTL